MRIALSLLLALLCSGVAREAHADELFRFDFGPATSCAPGWTCLGNRSPDWRFRWRGEGLSVRAREGTDPVARDFVTGPRGEFIVGLDNGDYQVQLTFGDPEFQYGPVNVYVEDVLVFRGRIMSPGEFASPTVPARVRDGRLTVRFEPILTGRYFLLNSLILHGPVQTAEHNAYDEPPPSILIPTPEELDAREAPDARATLREICDWILRQRRSDAFLEPNSSEWYRSAYAARTLLSGYEIFHDARYLVAVTTLLDRLVSEQLPNGAWSSSYSAVPVASRTQGQIEAAMSGTTNLADTGSIATVLSVASVYVSEPKRRLYLAAHRRYADLFAAQWQLPTGAFPNGRYQGVDYHVPYGVATGTQAMSFAALYAATRDERYLRIAEQAAEFLLDTWEADGTSTFHPHNCDCPVLAPATRFGDLYYELEGILWVDRWTMSARLHDRIRQMLGWYVSGSAGLLASRPSSTWWPIVQPWTNAKAAGMPIVLAEYSRGAVDDDEAAEALRRCAKFLRDRELARSIGVCAQPDAPWGEFSMSSTGHAGLSLAEVVQSGVIYMKGIKPRRVPLRRRL